MRCTLTPEARAARSAYSRLAARRTIRSGTRYAKWARGSRSQTHRRAAMGGFTQDDGYVRGVAADALRGILLQRDSSRPRVADNPPSPHSSSQALKPKPCIYGRYSSMHAVVTKVVSFSTSRSGIVFSFASFVPAGGIDGSCYSSLLPHAPRSSSIYHTHLPRPSHIRHSPDRSA